MAGQSIGTQMISDFFSNVQHNPVFLLSFVVPILMLLFASVAIRRYSKKTKIDGPPSLEQKREKFVVPKDFFNRETDRIKTDDYAYFLSPIANEFHNLVEFDDYFRVLEKRYKKFRSMSNSARKKRKQAGIEGSKNTFNDILNLYNRLRSTKFEIVEFERDEEGI